MNKPLTKYEMTELNDLIQGVESALEGLKKELDRYVYRSSNKTSYSLGISTGYARSKGIIDKWFPAFRQN